MNTEEIRVWLDKAFAHLYAGRMAAATACFEHVIERSEDARAKAIARRSIDWYCIPLDSIASALERAPGPVPFHELLSGVPGMPQLSQGEYTSVARELAAQLAQVQTVVHLGENLWIHRTCFSRAVDLAVRHLEAKGGAVPGAEFACQVFVPLGGQPLPLVPAVLDAVRQHFRTNKSLVILDEDCVFTRSALNRFVQDLTATISGSQRPVHLLDVISQMSWPDSVATQLKVPALSTWLTRQRPAELVEVSAGWWFLARLEQWETIDATAVFDTPYSLLDSQSVLYRCLFPAPPRPAQLSVDYCHTRTALLKRNKSLLASTDGLWFAASSMTDLLRQTIAELTRSDRPRRLPDVLIAAASNACSIAPQIQQAILGIAGELLAQDSRIIQVSQDLWWSRAAVYQAADRAFEILQAKPYSKLAELLVEIATGPQDARQYHEGFKVLFARILEEDERLVCLREAGVWLAIPDGDPTNNLAYKTLLLEHRPLMRQAIVDLAKNMPTQAATLAFQLESDHRFTQLGDGRWILAEWIILNDLAAAYLAQSPLPLLVNTIVRKLCDLNGLDPNRVIFDPEGDPRFIKVANGKWICRDPGRLVTPEMLERIVSIGDASDVGMILDSLTRQAFRETSSAFQNLELMLTDDGRLINSDGLWYSRTRCFYHVTAEDLARVKAHIRQIGYPVPVQTIADSCLHRPVKLTDLETRLKEDPEMVNLGASGWIVHGIQPESVGRTREINYPIRSGRYLPSITPELSVEVAEHASHTANGATSARQRDQNSGDARYVTLALGYEDIRDGSLVVTPALRRVLGRALQTAALRFRDERGDSFSCWHDAPHKLLHGFGGWFQAQDLTFGDEIRLHAPLADDMVRVEVTGKCNEQVHLEGQHRSKVQSLLEEARRAKHSYHDLILEVLDFFGVPLLIDDLWAMVSYRRVAHKSTLQEILSRESYFVSDGGGYWHFDKEEYARMIHELQQQVDQLRRDNQKLSSEVAGLLRQVAQGSSATQELDRLRDEVLALKETLSAVESRADEFHRQLDQQSTRSCELLEALGSSQANEREANKCATLAEQTAADRAVALDRLQADLAGALTEITRLEAQGQDHSLSITDLERRLTESASEANTLRARLQQISASEAESRQQLSDVNQALSVRAAELEKERGENLALAEAVRAAERDRTAMTKELALKEAALAELSAEVADLRAMAERVEALAEKENALNGHCSELEKKLAQAVTAQTATAEQNEQLGREMGEARAKNEQLTGELGDLCARLSDLEAIAVERQTVQAMLDERTVALQQMTEQIAAFEDSLRCAEAKAASALNERLHAQEVSTRLQTELEAKIIELADERARYMAASASLSSIPMLEAKIEALAANAEMMGADLTRLTGSLDEKEARLTEAQASVDRLNGCLAELQVQRNNLEMHNDELKNQLAKTQEELCTARAVLRTRGGQLVSWWARLRSHNLSDTPQR